MSSLTVIIPAVDEPEIGRTITSLLDQTLTPTRIIVAVNNTDKSITRDAALAVGSDRVEVRNLGRITGRKAGAINHVLATLPHEGLIMVMDADTQIVPTFIERALVDLERDDVAATGAVFGAEEATNYLTLCQRLEWVRYGTTIDITGRTWVLSGTAAIIKWEALDAVYNRFGFWYDETSITEDGRLSVDLKVCGYKITSPIECEATTEVMPTWRLLIKQRTRWFLGAMQTVRRMPWTKQSLPYLGQQLMLALSIICLWGLIAFTIITTVIFGFHFSLFWAIIGLIFVIERVVTIPGEPLKHKLFAALVVPELIYAMILQWAFIKAFIQFIRKSSGEWTHV